jgi:hypothetical protein
MIKILQGLLGNSSREQAVNKPASTGRSKRQNGSGDYRAVEIAPSIMCCAEAVRATGRPYLMREAPRVPLYGCTMPTKCACKFRKIADRRDSDRRLFGANETNRWFAGTDSRTCRSRRLTEK